MSRSKNTIKKSDISSAPIKVKYSATYASQSLLDYGITTNRGTNIVSPSPGLPFIKRNKYAVIRQLYYQNYITGSIIGSASYWDPSIQSTGASGSLDDDNRYFPSATGSNIGFFAIPSRQFGEQMSRRTVNIASTDGTSYNIIDDGNGNIVDTFNNNVHVGNVLYAQGIITFTNEDYVCLLADPSFDFTLSTLVAASPSPTPTVSSTPGASKSPTPSITATPTVTPSVTPSRGASPSATPSKTPSKTPSVSITPTKTVTPSITPTKTVTPSVTATPSISPSLPVVQGNIYVFGFNDGSGNVKVTGEITAGSVADDLTFTGTITKYTGTSCNGTNLGGCGFSTDIVYGGLSTELFIPSGSAYPQFYDSNPICDNGSGIYTANSWKPTTLRLNGINITSSPQDITISGKVYRITGYNQCSNIL
jgi:hypothetical protein